MNKFSKSIIRLAVSASIAVLSLPFAFQPAGAAGTTSLQISPKSGYPMNDWDSAFVYDITVSKSDNTPLNGQVCGNFQNLGSQCAKPDANGQATLWIFPGLVPSRGSYSVWFTYSGDNNHATSQTSLVQQIGPNITTVSIDGDAFVNTTLDNPDVIWVIVQPNMLRAFIDKSLLHPTGEIWLYDGNKHIGTAILQPSDAGNEPHSIAWFKRSKVTNFQTGEIFLVAGKHTLTATYVSDDDNFWSSNSKPAHIFIPIKITPRH